MSGYPKDCKFCGQKIKLSEDSGRWLPYNLDNTAHECRDRDKDSTTKKDKGNDKDKPPQPQPQNKKQLTLEDLDQRISKLDARLKRTESTLYGKED